jgi:hypothetical protein
MSTLKVHLTYQCVSECEHCRFGCMTRPAPVANSDLVMQVVAALKRHNDLQFVVLMGGEPALFAPSTSVPASKPTPFGQPMTQRPVSFWNRFMLMVCR